MTEVSPVEKYIFNREADSIGGTITVLLGSQGAGKTVGLWNKGKIDFEQERIVFWRGQETCQWVGLAANGLPVTLWFDECIDDLQAYLTGDIRSSEDMETFDLESAEDIDVEIRTFSHPEDMVEDPETDRINVYYLPGGKSSETHERYYFYRRNVDLAKALNNRPWGNHVSYLMDEIADVITREKRKPFYRLTEFVMPEEFGNFRKNNVSFMGTGHDTSDIHYKFWKVKANTLIYMQGAKVKSSLHPGIDQNMVNNNFKRGDFIVPGFEKDHFRMPYMPNETISWIPEGPERKLRMQIEADIPNIVPGDETAEKALEESPIDREHLMELIDVSETAEMLDVTTRAVRARIDNESLPAIKVRNKWLLSREDVQSVAG